MEALKEEIRMVKQQWYMISTSCLGAFIYYFNHLLGSFAGDSLVWSCVLLEFLYLEQHQNDIWILNSFQTVKRVGCTFSKWPLPFLTPTVVSLMKPLRPHLPHRECLHSDSNRNNKEIEHTGSVEGGPHVCSVVVFMLQHLFAVCEASHNKSLETRNKQSWCCRPW